MSGLRQYYYRLGKQEFGPVGIERIRELAASGEIDGETRMRSDVVSAWEPPQVYGIEIPEPLQPVVPLPPVAPVARSSWSGLGAVAWVILGLSAGAAWTIWPEDKAETAALRARYEIAAPGGSIAATRVFRLASSAIPGARSVVVVCLPVEGSTGAVLMALVASVDGELLAMNGTARDLTRGRPLIVDGRPVVVRDPHRPRTEVGDALADAILPTLGRCENR